MLKVALTEEAVQAVVGVKLSSLPKDAICYYEVLLPLVVLMDRFMD